MLIPAVRGIRPRIKRKLLQPLFIYSLPLLISGVTGTANEFIDRQFIKYLLPQESAMSTLGIYGAVLKLGGHFVVVCANVPFGCRTVFSG